MGGCCGLEMIEINGGLCCAQCNRPVSRKRNVGRDSMRCEVRYSCNLCGKEKYVKCGTAFFVTVSGMNGRKKVKAQ